MRHLANTNDHSLFCFMPSFIGLLGGERLLSFLQTNVAQTMPPVVPGQVCIAESCKELCSDERGCSLNDICVGGLCEDGHCGDGVKVQVEECDLGADNANDGLCLLDCTLNRCGDGFIYVGHEECDDGNLIDGDGCNASCERTTPQTVDESAPAHEPESESESQR